MLPELGRAGHDYVLIGRAETLTRSFQDLVADLRKALERTQREPRQGDQHAAKGRPQTEAR